MSILVKDEVMLWSGTLWDLVMVGGSEFVFLQYKNK